MIKTDPTYVDGGRLTLKEYVRHILANDKFLYSSVRSWWKKTTLFCGIPLLGACLLLFVLLAYQDWMAEGAD